VNTLEMYLLLCCLLSAPARLDDFPGEVYELGLWKPKGMKVEGLAVNASGETLYVGLREPADRARVYSVSLRRGEPEVSLLFEFDAGSVGETSYFISALTWEPMNGGLLLATSTEEERSHRFLGNRLWFVPLGGRESSATDVVLLWDRFDVGMKAEGLAVGAGKLFIVYDNDQDDTFDRGLKGESSFGLL